MLFPLNAITTWLVSHALLAAVNQESWFLSRPYFFVVAFTYMRDIRVYRSNGTILCEGRYREHV